MLANLRDRHSVAFREAEQAFANKCGLFLVDDREDQQTDPVTLWFVAPTNRDRLLKVIFMFVDGNIHLKSVCTADADALALYEGIAK